VHRIGCADQGDNAIEDGREEGHVEPVNPDLDLEIDPSLLPSASASP